MTKFFHLRKMQKALDKQGVLIPLADLRPLIDRNLSMRDNFFTIMASANRKNKRPKKVKMKRIKVGGDIYGKQ